MGEKVHECFKRCEEWMPKRRTSLRRTSFALRRAGVDTMEQLGCLRREHPEQLAGLRDIGVQSIAVIDEVIRFFEENGCI